MYLIWAKFGQYSAIFRQNSGRIWAKIRARSFSFVYFVACQNILSNVTCRNSCSPTPVLDTPPPPPPPPSETFKMCVPPPKKKKKMNRSHVHIHVYMYA